MLPWLAEPPSRLLADVRETSLSKVVRDEVLGLIVRGELEPGARINEPDVATRLQVSRVPVREALRELESSGLVVARKHSGVFVRVLEPREVDDLYELRALLDAHAGRRAAHLPAAGRKALARDLATHLTAMRTAANAGETQAYYAANLAFHWAIVEAAGNAALAQTYRGVVQQLHVSRLRNLSDRAGMRASIDEHRAIHAALVAGDAEELATLQAGHVLSAHERLVARRAAPVPHATPGDNAPGGADARPLRRERR